jgi:hypothetical protein
MYAITSDSDFGRNTNGISCYVECVNPGDVITLSYRPGTGGAVLYGDV